MTYLLDTNIFIESKNRYYGFDIAPGFWEWLNIVMTNGDINSIKNVYDELMKGKDEDLLTWINSRKGFFLDIDENTLKYAKDLSIWAENQNYKQHAINTFWQSADLFLVAHAKAHGFVVVTLEKPEPNRKSRIKIPEACQHLKVEYCNTFDMMRSLKAKLIL